MIVARLKNVNLGKAVRLKVFLNAEDLKALADGTPIHVPPAHLEPCGIKNLAIDVGYGETNEAIAKHLRDKHGILPVPSDT